jgi:hypothetical protein
MKNIFIAPWTCLRHFDLHIIIRWPENVKRVNKICIHCGHFIHCYILLNSVLFFSSSCSGYSSDFWVCVCGGGGNQYYNNNKSPNIAFHFFYYHKIYLHQIMAIFKEFMHCVNIPFHSQILHLFQFADEMSNSHIYKFSQNNLYSCNIIADSLRKIHISENWEKITVQRLKYQGVNEFL